MPKFPGMIYWVRAGMLATVVLIGLGLWKIAEAAGPALVAAFVVGYFYCMFDLWLRGAITDPEEPSPPPPTPPRQQSGS